MSKQFVGTKKDKARDSVSVYCVSAYTKKAASDCSCQNWLENLLELRCSSMMGARWQYFLVLQKLHGQWRI